MRRATLIVMVKEPVAGRVKTRLAKDIGAPGAAWWFRHQTACLLRRLRDPRWDMVLSVAPDTAIASSVWPGDLARMPQGRGDLGRRMARALRGARGPAVLIGGDIPEVSPIHVAEAFRLLGRNESVIGPARDGGFWLIGLRYPARGGRGLFHGVRWSHPETFREALPTLPTPVAVAATLQDVDTVADLRRVRGRRETA